MDKQYFTMTVTLGPGNDVSTFNLTPGYNHYHQVCASAAVHTWDEEDPLIKEPYMVSYDEYDQPTLRAKYKPIDIT